MDFEADLVDLLNKHGMNVYSHDNIMARHLIRSIDNFRESLREYNEIYNSQHVMGKTDALSNENAMGSTSTKATNN